MATLESTIGKEGRSAIRKNFLYSREAARGTLHNRRRYAFSLDNLNF